MPKTKTRKAAAKRFKVTGAGRLIRRRTMKIADGSGKRKRKFRKGADVATADVRRVKKQLNLR